MRRSSLLFQPGITILSKRNKFLKNSLLISTFFFVPSGVVDVPSRRVSACRLAAVFCSEMALRMRFNSVTNSVMYIARDNCVLALYKSRLRLAPALY